MNPTAASPVPSSAKVAGSGVFTGGLLALPRKNRSGPPVAPDRLADRATIQFVLNPGVFWRAFASVASSPNTLTQLLPWPGQVIRASGGADGPEPGKVAVNSRVVPAALNTLS